MIHYHGLPIWPAAASVEAIQRGHAFVSFHRPEQLGLAAEFAQSFAVDNGAFSAWTAGEPITDWSKFYDWAGEVATMPGCDFVVIPDAIDGDEAQNDRLIAEWPLAREIGAPVWHMHESLARLARMTHEWPRVCLGSSGDFSTVGTPQWWSRMNAAMAVVCDGHGRPRCRLHGLRMLSPKVFPLLPLASADSTSLARAVAFDSKWKGTYLPVNKVAKARVMRDRIESLNGALQWPATAP